MAKLPDELEELSALENLDISHNAFISLPYAVYKMPKLVDLNASNNYIIGNLLLISFLIEIFNSVQKRIHFAYYEDK